MAAANRGGLLPRGIVRGSLWRGKRRVAEEREEDYSAGSLGAPVGGSRGSTSFSACCRSSNAVPSSSSALLAAPTRPWWKSLRAASLSFCSSECARLTAVSASIRYLTHCSEWRACAMASRRVALLSASGPASGKIERVLPAANARLAP